jgi:hypothetical protein
MTTGMTEDSSHVDESYTHPLQVVKEQRQRIAKLEPTSGRRRFPGGRTGIILLSAVLAMSIGGVALASIPSANRVIHACYRTTGTHIVQVIDTSVAHCPSGTTVLNWNQRGRTGHRGPTGATGPMLDTPRSSEVSQSKKSR